MIVAPFQVGGVEFAAELFGTQLVVVPGHSKYGAKGTIDDFERPSNVLSIVTFQMSMTNILR
ncbi:MAG: hypothetical protein QNK31_06905 [Porticoccus sp.]|nr:hypothetical protein [Porticoccus sp.]